MFYSHVYLARKGPLGTVWAAAHLQQRLKKSHYTATNIPKTVDLIMFPEAPLALRLSGHLLLGVVRIYSKQVDYLFRDCALFTTWLSKSFVSTQVDLPEDARQAPVESVTLPQALNLDDFQLDDDTHEGEFDNHLRSQEDITLTDQIPTGVDPYVAITFDEDISSGPSPMDVDVFDKDCVSSKPYLAVPSESIPEPAPVSSPTREAEAGVHPTSSVPQSAVPDSTHPDDTLQRSPVRQTEDDDTGIERFRDGGYTDFMPSPPPRFSPSSRTDDFTTQTSRASETESYRTEPSTSAYRDDMPGLMTSGISAIPEMADEELYFLDVGGNTPVRSPASQDSDALTGRTRALAQYLKERSSVSPSSSTSSGDLSLGKILEGKTRKLAARMFFETLVLKSRGLIDMHQEQPYSDITLKLMPGLFSKVPE
ncbi:hypothetical protein DY000_02056631 [Brassica cretica]|uniref:Rad21/Rec8-like protein N-terminal domain-containing protein n=1 Tax=Brassica cretica TaxID=69181 RepID=A0ABQ7AJ13_BRACR|nr:hypothetical protein DY000_02056631 [Brassica cretica]